MTDPNDDLADAEESGGIVTVSPAYSDELGEFSELFESNERLREAARFALAIGIRTRTRVPRNTWKKGEPRRIAHLRGQFDAGGKYDFQLLFDILDLAEEGVRLNELVSEYVTGGMKWIADNQLKDGINFNKLKETFGDLFPTSSIENIGSES